MRASGRECGVLAHSLVLARWKKPTPRPWAWRARPARTGRPQTSRPLSASEPRRATPTCKRAGRGASENTLALAGSRRAVAPRLNLLSLSIPSPRPPSLPLSTHRHPGNAAAAQEFARVSAAAEALLSRRSGAPSFASGPSGGHRSPAPTSPAAAAAEAALRSRRFSLAFSGACLVGGLAIFAGALRVHTAVFGPDPVAVAAAARREDPPESVARVQEAVRAAVAERAREKRRG